MSTPFRIKSIALAVAAIQPGFMQANPVSAQPVLEEVILEEVIVTARKRAESLMDAPLSITAVSGDSLDEQGITNLMQLSSQVPGLTLGLNTQETSVYIRGIGSGINTGFEQSVGMFADGIYQSRSRQFSLSLVDVAQIEVLRGPQSIIFGKNTIAGTLSVQSSSPVIGDDFSGSITVDVEPEQNAVRGTVVLSGDLSDTMAGRIAMRHQEADGWVGNQVRDADEVEIEDKMIRGTLVWAPGDNVEVTAKVSHIDMDGSGSIYVNAVADRTLLATLGQPGNNLAATSIIGTIGAFSVPGFQAANSGREYKSFVANEVWYPGGTDSKSVKYTQGSLKADWDIDRFSITSLTGFTSFQQEVIQDVDFTGANFVGTDEPRDQDMFSQELRIASHFDGSLNFIAGLYFETQNSAGDAGSVSVDGTIGGVTATLPGSALSPAIPPGITLGQLGFSSLWNGTLFAALNPVVFGPLVGTEVDSIARITGNEIDNQSISVFFEAQYDITEDLVLELGGRYSEDEKKVKKTGALGVGIPGAVTTLVNPDGSLTSEGLADPRTTQLVATLWGGLVSTFPHEANLKREENHFDPSVRLLYQVNDDTLTYLSWSGGYKSGGFNGSGDTFNPDGTPGPGTEFEDETATAWELGVKSSFWDQRARLSAALFRTEIEDLQTTSFRGTTFLVGNAAESRSQGVEMDAQLALTESLEVGGAITYLDQEYTDYADAPCSIFQTAATPNDEECRQDLTGRRGLFAPEWSGLVYAHYETQLGNNLLLTLGGDAGYKGDHFTDSDLDPNTLQESYWKFNARIGLSDLDGNWELAVYGRNLSDEATYSFSVDSPFSAGIYGNGIEESRVYGLQARYNF